MRALSRILIVLLAVVTARMAARAVLRSRPEDGIRLWLLLYQAVSPAITKNTPKTGVVEARLAALIPKVPNPQPAPAAHSDSTSGTNNQSYSMGGGTNVTSNTQGSGNDGGSSSQTSGQIGGASAHVHSMTHFHVSHVDLQNAFNALQGTMSTVVPTVNTLQSSHAALSTAHNNLLTTLRATRVLQ